MCMKENITVCLSSYDGHELENCNLCWFMAEPQIPLEELTI